MPRSNQTDWFGIWVVEDILLGNDYSLFNRFSNKFSYLPYIPDLCNIFGTVNDFLVKRNKRHLEFFCCSYNNNIHTRQTALHCNIKIMCHTECRKIYQTYFWKRENFLANLPRKSVILCTSKHGCYHFYNDTHRNNGRQRPILQELEDLQSLF